MKKNSMDKLEFDVMLNQLAELALSQTAKNKALALTPFLSERECRQKLDETTQAKAIIDCFGTPPLSSMKELHKIIDFAKKGSMLTPEQLTTVAIFVTSCRRMKSYLKKADNQNIPLGVYGDAFCDLNELYEEIDRCVYNGTISDIASPAIKDIRRRIENAKSAVKVKLESILKSKSECFTDGYPVVRNGKLCLPVKKECKSKVEGSVVDTSGTGGTLFIEPLAVRKLQEEVSYLELDEDNEIRRILYTLTVLVDERSAEIKINQDCMETLDFAFAKAKLSLHQKANEVNISTERKINITKGRHPLLDRESCVPLDFSIGGDNRGIIITGPNTGGKTVSLKTIGLLSIMAQCGLHVTADRESTFTMNSNVLCDIGDGQSISENLSTFSSHIVNIIDVLKNTTEESLVLLDEVGSGTDPAEGMGLAVSILHELKQKHCLFVATTHYPEIKDFAKNEEGLINARMEFDRETLKPLYKLQIGEAGESCALYIAKRLGFPEHMLKIAKSQAYGIKSDKPNEQRAKIVSETDTIQSPKKQIKKEVVTEAKQHGYNYEMGDSVLVYPNKEVGIVYKPINELGDLVVQVKGQKKVINQKRIKLVTPAKTLYPDDYDFSIVFDTVENRKAKHTMDKKHDPNAKATYTETF